MNCTKVEKVTPYGMYRCRGGCGDVMGEAFGMKVGGMLFCYECYHRLMGNIRKPERHEKDAQHNDDGHSAA